jgi:CRISPR-associated protein Csb2
VSLLDKLADPPVYYLPRATAGNSRHLLGVGETERGSSKPEIVDSFVFCEQDTSPPVCAFVVWPQAALTQFEQGLLARLCVRLGALLTADPNCKVALCDSLRPGANTALVEIAPPVDRREGSGPVVRRLAVARDLRGQTLLGILLQDAWFPGAQNASRPAGAVWVEYRLPPDFLLVREQYEAREREPLAFGPILFRFAIEGSTRADQRPSITDSVILAEVMRRAVISRYSDLHGGTATTRLAGKDPAGVGKRTGHDHPFYLPVAADDDPRIIALDVWLPGGCTHAEYRAVTSVRRLISRDWRFGEIRLHFVGPVSPPTGKVWETVTPVVLDRFPKLRGSGPAKDLIDSPASQLRSMLDRRLSCSCTVTVWPDEQPVRFGTSTAIGQRSFQRRRSGDRPVYPTCSATLAFDEAVDGPIVLGRLAHFGLGQFRPSAS